MSLRRQYEAAMRRNARIPEAFSLAPRLTPHLPPARSGDVVNSFENEIPDLRPKGWTCRAYVGGGVAALFFNEDPIAIEHQCTRPRDGLTLLVAPRLTDGPAGHRVLNVDPLSIAPSILCADCGLHGFITDGQWRSA